jgi:hypothetical protein
MLNDTRAKTLRTSKVFNYNNTGKVRWELLVPAETERREAGVSEGKRRERTEPERVQKA